MILLFFIELLDFTVGLYIVAEDDDVMGGWLRLLRGEDFSPSYSVPITNKTRMNRTFYSRLIRAKDQMCDVDGFKPSKHATATCITPEYKRCRLYDTIAKRRC